MNGSTTISIFNLTQTGQIDVTQKMLTMLNELEKAHIYIAELNEDKKELAQALET